MKSQVRANRDGREGLLDAGNFRESEDGDLDWKTRRSCAGDVHRENAAEVGEGGGSVR